MTLTGWDMLIILALFVFARGIWIYADTIWLVFHWPKNPAEWRAQERRSRRL